MIEVLALTLFVEATIFGVHKLLGVLARPSRRFLRVQLQKGL